MQHSREMLPDPEEALRFLAQEVGLPEGTPLWAVKREWTKNATAVKRSRDAGRKHSRKRSREDQDERGTRPEA